MLGAVVVSSEEGSGTFIASFVNNKPDEPASLEALDPGRVNGAGGVLPGRDRPRGLVNLALDDQGIPVRATSAAGDFVPLSVSFGGGDTLEIDVPVVAAARVGGPRTARRPVAVRRGRPPRSTR